MKAAFVKRKDRVRIKDIPKPRPGKTEILIKIDACGICGSDFIEAKIWARKWKRFGHEMVATVAEIGKEVTGFANGDQVVVALSIPCGTCALCRNGSPRTCNNLIAVEQGGFAEYLLIKDQRLLYKVDPALSMELASFAEPLTVVLDALHLADLREGDHFFVVGGGFIGTLALLTAKILGANITGLLNREARSNVITCLNETGGDHFAWRTIAGRTISAPARLRKKLSGLSGRVVVLHTAPARHIALYLDLLPYGSTIVNIGLSAFPKENRLKIDASRLIFKRLQLMNAFPVPCLHLPQAVSLLREHSGLFSSLFVEKMPLSRLPEVITAADKPKRKILITM
ncbi:MAG: alcohol dehydrogenase catalytic domain-containing protein [Deltaproteobacteria bacterium]|nr:alcohol dehydrogenase catalytic domain-containing protein [Deltaproteobacteria bacterium]